MGRRNGCKPFLLDILTVIIDNNNFQQTGSNDSIMSLGDLSAVTFIGCKKINGHSYENIILR